MLIARRLFLGCFLCIIALSAIAQEANFVADSVCLGSHTTFSGTSSIHDSLISGWYWDMDNDTIFDDAFGKTVSHVFDSAVTFPIGVKVITTSGNEYVINNYKDVIVWPVPSVNFHVDNLCEGLEATYIDQSEIEYGVIDQYRWDFNNDGAPDLISDTSVVTYTCGAAQIYKTRLTVLSDRQCEAYATKTTEVFHQPFADFNAINGCRNTEISFNDDTDNSGATIMAYLWDFGDGEGEISQNTTHSYIVADTFLVQLVVISANNCKDTANSTVIIYPDPEVSITVSPDTVITEGESATLTIPDSYASVLWLDGPSTSSITVDQEGEYSVVVTDDNSCTASANIEIIVDLQPPESDEIIKSNIITPNGDGINEFLEINNITDYTSVSVAIYNSWGDEVGNFSSYNNDWNGSDCDPGAYYYIITIDAETITGNINILK